tara:strand:+ start:820 stop:981 length:162 start_codon:yes stop_codon:yes gene_type:complete
MDNDFKDKKPNNNILLQQIILMIEEIREQNKLIIEELSYIKPEKPKPKGWIWN